MNKKRIKVRQLLVEGAETIVFETTDEFFAHFGYNKHQRTQRWLDRGWFSPKNTDDLYEIWRDDIDETIERLERQLLMLKARRGTNE